MRDADPDHAAPPDLPAELLGEATTIQPSSAPAAAPPSPDLPDAVLFPAQPTGTLTHEVDGPSIAESLLTAAPADAVSGVPAEAPTLDPTMAPEPAAPHVAATEPIGPSESVPLAEEMVQFGEELSFEEKWDSLARQLQTSSPVLESTATPVPPDLPDEMLRAAGDVVPEDDDYEQE